MNPIRLAMKLLIWAQLAVIFLIELTKSSVSVAWAVVNPSIRLNPAIVAVPLDLKSDIHIATLANLVSLTPGTTSLHVSEDRKTLYVHALDCTDPEGVISGIKTTFESILLKSEA
jgi:multicomponent Na+:H+ antiporter subunit E